jgi:hypothetical protein
LRLVRMENLSMLGLTVAKRQMAGCDTDHAGATQKYKRPTGMNLRAVRWSVWD